MTAPNCRSPFPRFVAPWLRIRHSLFAIRHSRQAFTLVEMVVVVAVVLVLVGLVLPAATTMWNQRRISEAQNTVQGLLRSARAKAFQGERGDVGLFFYLDDAGQQQVVTIARNPFDPDDPPDSAQATAGAGELTAESAWRTDPCWRDVYTVASGGRQSMPASMRIVPRYAIAEQPQNDPDSHKYFSDEELASENFAAPIGNRDQAQRHRNYFSVLFSADGQVLPERDVLIRDLDRDSDDSSAPEYGKGDITGLEVSKKDNPPTGHYLANGQANVFGPDCNHPEPVVVDPGTQIALNFRSVDGLLVYDDSLFREAPAPADKRGVVVNTAQPFYIHHLTGAVVKGPAGENEAP